MSIQPWDMTQSRDQMLRKRMRTHSALGTIVCTVSIKLIQEKINFFTLCVSTGIAGRERGCGVVSSCDHALCQSPNTVFSSDALKITSIDISVPHEHYNKKTTTTTTTTALTTNNNNNDNIMKWTEVVTLSTY